MQISQVCLISKEEADQFDLSLLSKVPTIVIYCAKKKDSGYYDRGVFSL